MAGHGCQWLLRIYLFLMLARPLSPSTQPKENTGNMQQLLKDMEQQDTGPEMTPLLVVVAFSLAGFILELLLTGIVLRWCLGRRRQRRSEEEKCQSPSVSAETCCCKELLQVLKDNRALMRLSLRHSSLQRHRQKRPAKGGLWKRRRAALLPSALNSPTPAHLLALTAVQGDV